MLEMKKYHNAYAPNWQEMAAKDVMNVYPSTTLGDRGWKSMREDEMEQAGSKFRVRNRKLYLSYPG